ncbi:conserved hypothetical protein [Burkholderia ambifaria MEX-5]|uniref:Uncharacterized protein n=1 Tax=Burkholderia ambifaria MEX-5 TaxID=396597 RepID=B1TGW2_9BURK|nr:conserved hypothetical protein [Burkholderia ambifaria MEX-5]
MTRRADLDLGAVRHPLAHVIAEALERRRQVRVGILRHVGTARRHEPHPRRQRLIGRALDVLAHRVDEERGLLDRVARLHLVALDAHREEPREVRQEQHADDQQRQPPEQ